MTKVKTAHKDEELDMMLKALGGERCTIFFFFLPWCGSCQKMSPFVEAIAERNPNSLFIKVDAEKCIGASKKHKITKVPLFILYKNRIRVDRVEGAAPVELESKIKRIESDISIKKSGAVHLMSGGGGISMGASIPTIKMSDISAYIDKKNCRVLNDLVPTAFIGFLEGNSKLVSGKGVGRVLLMYAFTEKMVIQSFKIKAPIHSGPKILRFFTTLARNIDINEVNQIPSAYEVMLTEDDLKGEHNIDLRQGSFIGLNSLQIFIPESMTKGRRIELDFLILNGAPLTHTPYGLSEPSEISGRIITGPGIRY